MFSSNLMQSTHAIWTFGLWNFTLAKIVKPDHETAQAGLSSNTSDLYLGCACSGWLVALLLLMSYFRLQCITHICDIWKEALKFKCKQLT
jgi:hypothetical protein